MKLVVKIGFPISPAKEDGKDRYESLLNILSQSLAFISKQLYDFTGDMKFVLYMNCICLLCHQLQLVGEESLLNTLKQASACFSSGGANVQSYVSRDLSALQLAHPRKPPDDHPLSGAYDL